jgi:hypothetical protein
MAIIRLGSVIVAKMIKTLHNSYVESYLSLPQIFDIEPNRKTNLAKFTLVFQIWLLRESGKLADLWMILAP